MSELYLRPVNNDDKLLLLKWRNDQITRMNSFSEDVVTEEEHAGWLEKKISDPDCLLFLMFSGDDPVGHIRIDRCGDIGEVSYVIAPNMRNRGFGTRILALAEQEISRNVRAMVGFVKQGNEYSEKAFIKNGYSEVSVQGISCYIKVIDSAKQ